jgi:phosphohistidine phosphatase
MELYLIRHAEAVAVGQNGVADDEERPLSENGRAQCRALAEALQRQNVKLDKIVTSPLLRAKQTAEALIEQLPSPAPELFECNALRPDGKRKKLNRFLHSLDAGAIAVVGHNPDLSTYAAWLIGGKEVQVDLAKAGVARIEVEGALEKGGGTLTWMVTPDWYAVPQPAPG